MFWDLIQQFPGLAGVDKFTAVFTAAFGTLSDGKMWRSLGWLILGLVLIVIGMLALLRAPLANKAQQAGELAALVA